MTRDFHEGARRSPGAERPNAHPAVLRSLGDAFQGSDTIPFDTFMRIALYDPDGGYYVAGRGADRLGRSGDFFTSASVGACFGNLVARHAAELWENLGRPADFAWIEAGANDGTLTADVLAGLERCAPELRETIDVHLVEAGAPARERLRHRLPGAVVAAELGDLPPAPAGILFANELIDALPVRCLVFRAGAWRERRVARLDEPGTFAWTEAEIAEPALAAFAERLGAGFPDGYVTEANLGMAGWLDAAANAIERGWITLVDYGYPAHEFHRPSRTAGTLRTYHRHRAGDDPFDAPGGRDITAHVDFTALAEAAQAAGLEVVGFGDQHHFLTRLAAPWLRELEGAPGRLALPETQAALRQFRTLTHPDLMGRSFKVLTLARTQAGAPPSPRPAELPGDPWERLRPTG